MTTAQDQQSRALIAAWNAQADEHNQWETLGDDEKIYWAMQAARALPAGVTPVAKIHKGKLTWSIPWTEYSVDTALLTGGHDLFTASQVLDMGRVPPGWQALPLVATPEMLAEIELIDGYSLQALTVRYQALLAAAPQPPSAQELGEVVITKNEAGAIVAVTRQDEEGRILSVLAESAAQEREPLDQVAAMKLGMAADDATRKHCRGTTNWAHAMTRFYEKSLERMPTWEPKFDVMAPRQEELAVQFCNEISGPLGKPGRAPDPVRLLEMAEELYKAERDAARAAKEFS